MFKNFLFDLDGTLLGLDLDIFLPEYFSLLKEEFDDLPGEILVERVLKATDAMVHNDGQKTNKEIFCQVFFHEHIWGEEILGPRFEKFYRDSFSTLKRTARPLPLSQEILTLLFNQKKRVVLATNPLFPKEAILERMRWAGIHDFPFSLITSYEEMHYSKPNPAYYKEILDRIEGDSKETLMVGNDTREDMVAEKLGITTFLVKEYAIYHDEGSYSPHHEGDLHDLYQYLQTILR